MFVNVFGLPLTALGALIAFRYEIYESMQEYSKQLIEFVTLQVEDADEVTPADVHEWSSTLRAAKLYRRSSDAAIYFGYGSIISWVMSVGLSRLDLFQLGSTTLPIVKTSISTMAAIFSFGLFSLLLFTICALFYVDHSRNTSVSIESGEQTELESNA